MIRIYRLTHPSSTRLYIGKTIRSLEKRLYGHMDESTRHIHIRKNRWIRSLVSKGFTPEISLIEEVDENLGDEREKFWIKLGWQVAPKDILNSPSMPGGEGFQPGHKHNKKSKDKSARNKRKLTNLNLQSIATRISNGEFIKDIAREYSVNRTTISNNLKGRVIDTVPIKYKSNHPIGENHHEGKLSQEKVKTIREKYTSGKFDQYDLANEFGVSQSLITEVINNKIWHNTNYVKPNIKSMRRKLTDQQLIEIVKKLKNKESIKIILKEYPVSQTQVYRMREKINKGEIKWR